MWLADAPDESLEWLTATKARALLAPLYEHVNHAASAIMKRAAGGLIASRCERIEFTRSNTVSTQRNDDCLVSASFWKAMTNGGCMTDDWAAGDFTARSQVGRDWDSATQITHVYGVRFCGDDLRKISGVDPKPLTHEEQRAKNLEQWQTVLEALRPAIERMNAVILPSQAPSASAPKGGSVSNAEVDAWYGSLTSDQQAFSVRNLYIAANEHFAPRKVVRSQVETFGKDRPTGPRRRR